MKSRRFEKLSLIESHKGPKIDFENKCDIFIEAIYLKLPKISKKYSNLNSNHNFNLREKI